MISKAIAMFLILLPLAWAAPQDSRDPVEGDWLVTQVKERAVVHQSEDGKEIVLTNGLIRRVWRIEPNAACTAFDNVTTGQALVRAVRPEARVAINGMTCDVGGLTGQPNHAFLTREWLDAMEADPRAFQFTGYVTGEPRKRFEWKRVRHHAPGAKWPPEGAYLRLDFTMPATAWTALAADRLLDSAEGRDVLIEDSFSKLDPAWRIERSEKDERVSFVNEGKPGEIFAPANCFVFAERALPAKTRLVECTIHPGTDRSASWGPGLTLLFGGRVVKFYLRPGGGGGYAGAQRFGDFGLFDGRRELLDRGRHLGADRALLDMDRAHSLRIRLEEKTLFCEAASAGSEWRTVFTVPRDASLGEPTAVRVGKSSRTGTGDDHGTPGDWGRCRIERFAAYSGLDREHRSRIEAWAKTMRDLGVSVHYEMYDGIPVMQKWITVQNNTTKPINVDSFTSEILAVVEHSNPVEYREGVTLPEPDSLHVETDYAFGAFQVNTASRFSVHWLPDPEFTTQVNWSLKMPCLLEVKPTLGPDQTVNPGETFESFRAFELVHDSKDFERRGLALRRMYRTVAPWVTENPLILHVVSIDPATVRRAVDQAAECGFEMVSLSFGSGLSMENESAANIAKFKELVDYAARKGIHLGGYSLLSSRRVSPSEDNIVNPKTGKPGGQTHGFCPALASGWGKDYFRKLYKFFEGTGFLQFTHDGSYPGDFDAAARPPLQKGVADSQWVQWKIITDFYKWQRGRGVYVRVPDYYYLSGSNECGMGYREVNWSLPRAQQVIHTRQNIFDGTWQKTPSMGWMFVPLTQYHGGGAAATIEPLDSHLPHYERMMSGNLGAGVQAVYRGFRLYDTERTRDLVMRMVGWYKRYRHILESDIVHSSSRRADGRDIDWFFHANAALDQKGMLVVYNPLGEKVSRTIRLGLYYTGLTDKASIREREGKPRTYTIDRNFCVKLPVEVEAGGFTWFVVEK